MHLKHLNMRISGRVQGVSFRMAVRTQANSLGITGLVRNEPDGTVYLEAEGAPRALRQLVAWCQAGTPLAHVTGVTVTEDALKHFSDFFITD